MRAPIGFTLGISLVSAILFAIIPAVKGSRWTPGPSLSARATTGEGNRWRHAMIAIEAALSVFLLCGAGLVAQNLWTLISTPMGFDPSHVLAMQLKLPARIRMPSTRSAASVFQDYLDKIAAIPGVEAAATVTGPPLRPARGGPTELVGVTDETGKLKSVIGDNHLVSPDYFRTLRIPLLAGRTFRRDDAGRQVTVAIVNQEFARRFGLGADIVGRQIDEPGAPITIVGMAGNVRTRGLRTAPFPEIYLSSLQLSWANVYLVVRSALPPEQLLKQVKAAIGSANSEQAVFGVQTMDEADCGFRSRAALRCVSDRRFRAARRGDGSRGHVQRDCLPGLAAHRRDCHPHGVGREPRRHRPHHSGNHHRLGGGGIGRRPGLGLATRNTVRSLSNAAASGSPWMYASVVLFFLVVTLVAAYMPMRRASRLNPAAALRCE